VVASRARESYIAIGGAALATEAAFSFPGASVGVDLELVQTRTFSSQIVYLRYRVAR
jgi:hypothetical protein